jgi:hypothetical protein
MIVAHMIAYNFMEAEANRGATLQSAPEGWNWRGGNWPAAKALEKDHRRDHQHRDAVLQREANVESCTGSAAVMAELGSYRYEHIFIDNSSGDRTVEILKGIAAKDTNVRIIVNARNFGHVRSPIHALYQATGDAVIGIVADARPPR